MRSIKESRNVAHTLMPQAIADFGLIRTIESLLDSLNEGSEETEYLFTHNLDDSLISSQEIKIPMYRVLQEALNNAVNYAKASRVQVQLNRYEDLLTLMIEDNGIGFDPASIDSIHGGFGLSSMSNRLDAIGGFLEIDSRPQRGTSIIDEVAGVF